MKTNKEDAIQIKKDIDETIDTCVLAINACMAKWSEPAVKQIIKHRIVNYLWILVNRHIYESAIPQQQQQIDETLNKKSETT